jgi:hypothetical protein
MMPSFLAAVAPVYFLPLRKSTDPPLALDFDTLGGIFSGTSCVISCLSCARCFVRCELALSATCLLACAGRVTHWHDPAIVANNQV